MGNLSSLGKDWEGNAVSGQSEQCLGPRTARQLGPAACPGQEDSGLPTGWRCSPPHQVRTAKERKTHIQAAQNAGSNSPCPTGVPTLGATNPGLQSLCIWKPPKSSKHVPTSPPHSRHAWQFTDDHPKEAKGCLDRNFRSGIKVRVSLRSRRHQRVSSQ